MIEMNEASIHSHNLNLDGDDINSWSNYFDIRAREAGIFDTTINASKVDSNQARMRILKIAWEELGEGKAKKIHSATTFDLDPSFVLRDPSKKRILSDKLSEVYLAHDKLREKLTRLIP